MPFRSIPFSEGSVYVCPCGVKFVYSTSTRSGYHEYKPDVKGSCVGCPAANGKGDRVFRVSVHQEVYQQMKKRRLSEKGKVFRLVRPATIERSFAESKELHGLRFARYRVRGEHAVRMPSRQANRLPTTAEKLEIEQCQLVFIG